MSRLRTKKVVLISTIAILLCAGGTYVYFDRFKPANKNTAAQQEATYTVKKGNLRSVISGTAQLEPQELQSIVPPKEGMIKSINLSRNQPVKKGDLLLELSDSALDEKLDQATVTLSQLQSDMDDLLQQQASLKTVASTSGKLILASNITEGAGVSKTTKIGTIADTSVLTVTLPFLQEDAAQLKAGDQVQLTIDGFMLTKSGTIDSLAAGTKSDTKGNRLVDVKVRVENDGSLDAGLNVKGSVTIGGQAVDAKALAALQYKTTKTVLAGVNGTISHMEITGDQLVEAGELICTIESDTLDRDMTQKRLQINQQQKSIDDVKTQLEKLKVFAPFDGIFSTDFADQKKNVLTSYPVGTTIESGVQLGAVANLDTLQLPIKVDELDLPKIKQGQKAEVHVDAVPGKVFQADVTQVSTVGTVTNGVTFFTAVLSIKNSSELKNGMTATADIIIEDRRNVPLMPIEALHQRAGKKYVAVKNPDGTIDQEHEVKTGANNSTQIEITEGLKEGDVIILQQARQQRKLSQQEIDQMRQQFQQGARPGGAAGGGNNARQGGGGGFPGGGGR
ncbi:efflux RND transporter periplasmic adaptor subunit [Paenibacillus thalictri]|uniref:Efflux RND transporter periplasmic adaptor subunit n=1 Tax=Paenibacillus thalictri TaxID=2527873 RepID=A0A4Q9DM37_9BACL|nr:efflux RND transporter periplasmic adaptor subunit [Paenibacillus thalictri]